MWHRPRPARRSALPALGRRTSRGNACRATQGVAVVTPARWIARVVPGIPCCSIPPAVWTALPDILEIRRATAASLAQRGVSPAPTASPIAPPVQTGHTCSTQTAWTPAPTGIFKIQVRACVCRVLADAPSTRRGKPSAFHVRRGCTSSVLTVSQNALRAISKTW